MYRYVDKRFSFTNATSFAIMARLGTEKTCTFDSNSGQYGFRLAQA
jgi:predicted nucleic acid-binding protein